MDIQIKSLTEEYFLQYKLKCQNLIQAPLFLPKVYNANLWGVVVLLGDELIAGWVGNLRGNKSIMKCFVKGVWFDSLPIMFGENYTDELYLEMVEYAKKIARHEGIITFNVTHWSRQGLKANNYIDIKENCATYMIDLRLNIDDLWNNIESKLRKRTISKAIKTEIQIFEKNGNDAIKYLNTFQKLRQETQERAINNNSKTSMLLKSNNFFIDILQNQNSCFFIAQDKDIIVSMALMIISGKTMYYYMGGSELIENRRTGSSSLLFWKAIEFAKKLNLTFFDFGGVPFNPDENHPAFGVYSFKKSFGGIYQEFSSGKIIVNKRIYPILGFLLNNRFLLRFLSKKEK